MVGTVTDTLLAAAVRAAFTEFRRFCRISRNMMAMTPEDGNHAVCVSQPNECHKYTLRLISPYMLCDLVRSPSDLLFFPPKCGTVKIILVIR